ncbi:alpha/beta hydrolase [Neiella marina]|uniref:Alpha/beta hydrolase n=1 Tax=Neiella holothuriorum TaxID=2870530 RepID=A0ABS7EJS0_9GAMM|nr:alpha/beta hydrolase [Neiella holothuriorum]MBW8192594.1 alpha/beta hydrolase [Neiella holothuriorum]
MTLVARFISAALLFCACFSYGQDTKPQQPTQPQVEAQAAQQAEPVIEANSPLTATEAAPAEPASQAAELSVDAKTPTVDEKSPAVDEKTAAVETTEQTPAPANSVEVVEVVGVEIESIEESTRDESFHMADVTINYRVMGSGDPVLLVHGFLDSAELWDPYVRLLAEHYMVIVPDLRGHGRSTNPSGKFSYRDAAADMSALMAHLNVTKFNAVGYSEGALILTRMAIEQPKRIGKLTLIGAGPYMAESGRENLRKVQYFTNLSKSLQAELIRLHQTEDKAVSLINQFYALAADYSEPNFTPPLLGKIQANVLMINSVPDKYFLLKPALEQYQHLTKASLWIIPDRGHNLVFYDAPETLQAEFLRVLMNHLDQ